MIFKAVLSNKAHPEYGAATIPFPIPDDQYDHTIDLLHGIGIGDAAVQDCRVDETLFCIPILNRLAGQAVNVDELDYLAKRLDSFVNGEGLQFEAMASVLALSDIKDLINLTFCCQQATVIADFSDLEQIGKDHSMNINGGSMPVEEYQALDGQSIALDLIQSGTGVVTPYGVAYDNGMKLEPVYNGRHLPEFYHEPCVAAVTLMPIGRPKERELLYLPCPASKINRAVQRLGAEKPWQCRAELDSDDICVEVLSIFEEDIQGPSYHLDTLNQLAQCYQRFRSGDMEKFLTVVDASWPQTPSETVYLAQNLPHFTVVQGINSAEEYGRHIAQEMRVDAEVLEFLDLQRLGQHQIDAEGGVFGDRGYVAYKGSQPEVKEIMARHVPSGQEPQMGELNL